MIFLYLIYLLIYLFLKLFYKASFNFQAEYIDDRVVIIFFLSMLLLSIVNIEVKNNSIKFRVNINIDSENIRCINIGTTVVPMFFCIYLFYFMPLLSALITALLVLSIPLLITSIKSKKPQKITYLIVIIMLSILIPLLIVPQSAGLLTVSIGIFGIVIAGNILKNKIDKKKLQIGGSNILNAILILLIIGLAI